MSVRLDDLVEATRDAVDRRKRERPLSELEREVDTGREGRPFAEALSRPGTSLIAEHKRRSPSAGSIREGTSCAEIVQAYERGGAAAVSVLTEEAHFGGSLADLRRGAGGHRAADPPQGLHRRPLPALRGQGRRAPTPCCSWSARCARRSWPSLYALAQDLDLDAIVEVSREDELEAALEIDADVLGINNRDLEDLTVDLHRTFDLIADVPAGKVVVSESGIYARHQIDELEQVGVDAVLIGETLMRAPDPEAAVRELTRSEE